MALAKDYAINMAMHLKAVKQALLPMLENAFTNAYEDFDVDIPNAVAIKRILNNWRTGKDHWGKFNTTRYNQYDSWWGDTMDKLRKEKLHPIVWAIESTTNDQNVTAAVAALIAHPECHTLLEASPDALRVFRESGNHEAKLLYPAVCLLNGVEP